MTGPQRVAPHGPVAARVRLRISSMDLAPLSIAFWMTPRRILLQRQTTLYDSMTASLRRSSSSSGMSATGGAYHAELPGSRPGSTPHADEAS